MSFTAVLFPPSARRHVFAFPEKAVKAALGIESTIHGDLQYLLAVVPQQGLLDISQAIVVDTIKEVHTD